MTAALPMTNWDHSLAGVQAPRLATAAASKPRQGFEVIGSSDFRQFLRGHHRRVGELCRLVAHKMGFTAAKADAIAQAGALHDIGKLFVSEAIFQHEGPLDAEQQMAVRSHSFWGYVTLRRSEDPVIQLAAAVALQHHERWDGKGYPFGLSGEDIRIEARIVMVCDVYDALRTERPYKGGSSHDEAMDKILNGDERITPAMFDPDVLTAFAGIQDECRDLFAGL